MVTNLTLQQLIFYGFSFWAVVSACSVVISKNPVRAALFLVLTFFFMAGIWMLLEAEFLAITLVLVYVGAVMVLFLFVIMMIDIEAPQMFRSFVRYWPVSLLVGSVLIAIMCIAVQQSSFGLENMPVPAPKPADYSHVKALGELLYSDFLLPFEIAGIILLVAMIAAIGLTFRGPQAKKTQNIGHQVQVRKQDRLQIIKMNSEKRPS
tara:strand:- start:23247 stop:23867 length:621 start_codon:yes stop_codon:yes gene_type:complete